LIYDKKYFNNKIFNELKYNQQFIIYEFSKNIRDIGHITKILYSNDDYFIGKFFRPIKSDNLNITIFALTLITTLTI
jgi:hypothetical protein